MIKRLTAKKVRIFDIINGKYFPGSKEELKPGYVITPFGDKVSRANIIATVTEKFTNVEGTYSNVTIDDGTEAMQVRVFRDGIRILENINPGDLVLVIGKVKEYNGELYINGEIAKKVYDSNFETLRKSEITADIMEKKKIVDDIRGVSESMSEEEMRTYASEKYSMDEETLQAILESKKLEVDYKPKVLDVISKMDEGDGVEISRLFEILDMPEQMIEKTLSELINLGYLFEPKIGFLKKV